jgi:hypothetical protein
MSDREGEHPLPESPETLGKPLSKVSEPGFEIRGKSPELSAN